MKYRWIAGVLICAMLCGLCGCHKSAVLQERENSAGTNFGVSQKSALTLQDLYELRPGTDRDAVKEALGSPHSFIVSNADTETYRLADGSVLELVYTDGEKIKSALFTDVAGKKQDLFAYLNTLGIIKNYTSSGTEETTDTTEQGSETNEEELDHPEVEAPQTAVNEYFSSKRYSYDMADQILKSDAERETVVSALGKPNYFSSVDFSADSYIVDVYVMEDGSSLYLDYGYERTKLRAVRQTKGTAIADYLGKWEPAKKASGFIRTTRNQQVFTSLKKNTKPAEFYRRYGEPDWLEGNENHYRDAYQLQNGAVLYLDFGADHAALTAAVQQKADGTMVNYTLK